MAFSDSYGFLCNGDYILSFPIQFFVIYFYHLTAFAKIWNSSCYIGKFCLVTEMIIKFLHEDNFQWIWVEYTLSDYFWFSNFFHK